MKKVMSAADVVAELRDGMTIGIAGWGARRKPMALVREIVRSTLRDLTLVAYGGPDVGLLCAAGKVRKVVFGFVSLDVIALDNHFRRARQEGAIEAMELDEGMLQWGLYAAALRLPFLPTRAGLATDVERVNPQIKTVRSPYADGETLLAMPAIPLDAALVHVNHCDARGNAQMLGPDPYFDEFFCGAARRRYVSCERIVETDEFAKHGPIQTMLLNRTHVDGVIEAPFGAHPASCAPRYGIDAEHLRLYNDAARDAASFEAYRKRFIDGGEAAYLEAVGGAARVAAIPQAVF
jgi:glutaconate CoA-transferase subunit A